MTNKKQAKGLEGIVPKSWIGDMVCPLPDVDHQDKRGSWGYLARISPTRVELVDSGYHTIAKFGCTINLDKILKIARKNGLAKTYHLKYMDGFCRQIPETETEGYYERGHYVKKGNRLVRKKERYDKFQGKRDDVSVQELLRLDGLSDEEIKQFFK
jgi:hypothetical protein